MARLRQIVGIRAQLSQQTRVGGVGEHREDRGDRHGSIMQAARGSTPTRQLASASESRPWRGPMDAYGADAGTVGVVTLEPGPDDKQMKLRYAGTCRLCGVLHSAGDDAIYERPLRTIRCVECPTAMRAPEAGAAGVSARREYERRKDNREQRIRENHPKLGLEFNPALSDDPQSTRAWETWCDRRRTDGATTQRPTRHLSDTARPPHPGTERTSTTSPSDHPECG